jgi:hypothetical protein
MPISVQEHWPVQRNAEPPCPISRSTPRQSGVWPGLLSNESTTSHDAFFCNDGCPWRYSCFGQWSFSGSCAVGSLRWHLAGASCDECGLVCPELLLHAGHCRRPGSLARRIWSIPDERVRRRGAGRQRHPRGPAQPGSGRCLRPASAQRRSGYVERGGHLHRPLDGSAQRGTSRSRVAADGEQKPGRRKRDA